jgi:hypothetical protein
MLKRTRLLWLLILACLSAGSAFADDPDWRQQALDQAQRAAIAALAQSQSHGSGKADDSGQNLPVAVSAAAPDWQVAVSLYENGSVVAKAAGTGISLRQSARAAGLNLVAAGQRKFTAAELAKFRWFLTVRGPKVNGSIVSYRGKALEIVGDVTAVRVLSRDLVREAIFAQKEYLLRQMNPEYHAFYKLYDAKNDQPETRMRTTYTASALWTLLQMHAFQPDPRIAARIRPIADYLLSMQVQEGKGKGAFHYSFDTVTKEKQLRFVVGSTAKTVFTLLELYRRTGEQRYLTAAQNAGEWLRSRVRLDGRVYPVLVWSKTKQRWSQISKQSVLYSSETLSALSQLHSVSKNRRFARAAGRIAERLLAQALASNYLLGDDFRHQNSISTSWLSMAFLDYALINPEPKFSDAIFGAAHSLVNLQLKDPTNALDYGRYSDTLASSGNGWINEVFIQVYQRCVKLQRSDCTSYAKSMNRGTRWLIQNIYSPENSYHIPNPLRAQGGSIRDSKEETVRTDAVCHGGNSLVGVLGLGLSLSVQLPATNQEPIPVIRMTRTK